MSKRDLEIKAVMTIFPHTIGGGQNLATAKSMMGEYGIRHLPVKSGGTLVGILSDRDINFALAVDKKEPEEILVNDTYTEEPYIVEPSESVSEVATKMADDQIGCCLVSKDKKLVGIFTTVDACRALSNVLNKKIC